MLNLDPEGMRISIDLERLRDALELTIGNISGIGQR